MRERPFHLTILPLCRSNEVMKSKWRGRQWLLLSFEAKVSPRIGGPFTWPPIHEQWQQMNERRRGSVNKTTGSNNDNINRDLPLQLICSERRSFPHIIGERSNGKEERERELRFWSNSQAAQILWTKNGTNQFPADKFNTLVKLISIISILN